MAKKKGTTKFSKLGKKAKIRAAKDYKRDNDDLSDPLSLVGCIEFLMDHDEDDVYNKEGKINGFDSFVGKGPGLAKKTVKKVKKIIKTPEEFFDILTSAQDFVWDETPCTLEVFLGALKDDMITVIEEGKEFRYH